MSQEVQCIQYAGKVLSFNDPWSGFLAQKRQAALQCILCGCGMNVEITSGQYWQCLNSLLPIAAADGLSAAKQYGASIRFNIDLPPFRIRIR